MTASRDRRHGQGRPVAARMKRKAYEKELRKAPGQLCHLQEWVKEKKLRVIILFEGRDAAGKGGTIKAITEKVSPRVFRVVALPAPSDREKTQMFLQRYMRAFSGRRRNRHLRPQLVQSRRRRICHGLLHRRRTRPLPGAVSADRATRRGGRHHPDQALARGRHGGAGAALQGEDRRSAAAMEAEPDGHRVLSPVVCLFARPRPDARGRPSSTHAPWQIIRSDDKRRARLNCIAHLLKTIPHKQVERDKIKLPARSDKGRYDDQRACAA